MSRKEEEARISRTEHRIFCEWSGDGGGYVSSLDPDFQSVLQEMTKKLGPPTLVEFRADGEGWVRDEDEGT